MQAARPALCDLSKKQFAEQLQKAKSEVKTMENKRNSLGIFKGKEKKALTEQIESQKQMIAEMEAHYPDGKPVWKYTLREPFRHFDAIADAKARMASFDKPKKDKSILGSAAVGAFIAGPTGAVVGAVYAADKNQRNRK